MSEAVWLDAAEAGIEGSSNQQAAVCVVPTCASATGKAGGGSVEQIGIAYGQRG
jgi:hypothetical protein